MNPMVIVRNNWDGDIYVYVYISEMATQFQGQGFWELVRILDKQYSYTSYRKMPLFIKSKMSIKNKMPSSKVYCCSRGVHKPCSSSFSQLCVSLLFKPTVFMYSQRVAQASLGDSLGSFPLVFSLRHRQTISEVSPNWILKLEYLLFLLYIAYIHTHTEDFKEHIFKEHTVSRSCLFVCFLICLEFWKL